MDKEVLRDIWHGKLPLCFKLHPDDVSGMHRPEPYYMMVPRVTYFPIVLDRVVKYFNRFMDQGKSSIDEMWLDYDGQPIKWQHPIGLSWDLFGSSYDLPWRLILHFSDFPSKDLVRCNTKSSIKTMFMSTIKEADSLKHRGSITKMMLEKDQNLLWSSLLNDKFDQFWSVNKRLMDKIDNESYKFIPFRLYFPDYTYVQKAIRPCTLEKQIFEHPGDAESTNIPTAVAFPTENPSHKCGHSTSELDEAKKNNLEHRFSTMLDLIQVTFTDRLQDLTDEFELAGEVEGDTAVRNQEHGMINSKSFKFKFLSQGIEIPFNTPLQWLSEHLSYPDNFLHICAVNKSEPAQYI